MSEQLREAAQALVDTIGKQLDEQPWPQKYGVPYGAVNDLIAALAAQPASPASLQEPHLSVSKGFVPPGWPIDHTLATPQPLPTGPVEAQEPIAEVCLDENGLFDVRFMDGNPDVEEGTKLYTRPVEAQEQPAGEAPVGYQVVNKRGEAATGFYYEKCRDEATMLDELYPANAPHAVRSLYAGPVKTALTDELMAKLSNDLLLVDPRTRAFDRVRNYTAAILAVARPQAASLPTGPREGNIAQAIMLAKRLDLIDAEPGQMRAIVALLQCA